MEDQGIIAAVRGALTWKGLLGAAITYGQAKLGADIAQALLFDGGTGRLECEVSSLAFPDGASLSFAPGEGTVGRTFQGREVRWLEGDVIRREWADAGSRFVAGDLTLLGYSVSTSPRRRPEPGSTCRGRC